MALFGVTDAELLQYLAPKNDTDLANFGYDNTKRVELLDEKAEIVFSYLPQNYRRLYEFRVYRIVVVEFAYEGQTEANDIFTATNIKGYVNPSGTVEDLRNATAVPITDTGSVWNFSALSQGDVLIADFTHDFTNHEIKPLRWATRVLAALEIISQLSEEIENGELVERVMEEGKKVFPWLQALNSSDPGDKVIIKELEKQFWDGDETFTSDFRRLSRSASISRG